MSNYSQQVSVNKDWTSIIEEEVLFASTAVDPVFRALLLKVKMNRKSKRVRFAIIGFEIF